MKIDVTRIFKENLQATEDIIINQGGSRSSKTYSLVQMIALSYCFANRGKVISIVRKTLPSLKQTVMRDFMEVLNTHDLYDKRHHNKSDSTYVLNGNLVEFVSLDQPQKKRGAKRDLLYINEANDLAWDDFYQLYMRTTGQIYIDFNPSEEFWVHTKLPLLKDKSIKWIQSTYKDNPFLEDSIIKAIESLKEVDENLWRVYGLGELGIPREVVFPRWQEGNIPDDAEYLGYGMDFGYSNDPTAVIDLYKKDNNIYFDEVLYQTGLTNPNLFNNLKDTHLLSNGVADSAEPKSIEELRSRGLRIVKADKGKDSIAYGIETIKRHKIFITPRSKNLIKEAKNYKYRVDRNGDITNVPIDAFNHGWDACRYVATKRLSKPNFGRYAIRK